MSHPDRQSRSRFLLWKATPHTHNMLLVLLPAKRIQIGPSPEGKHPLNDSTSHPSLRGIPLESQPPSRSCVVQHDRGPRPPSPPEEDFGHFTAALSGLVPFLCFRLRLRTTMRRALRAPNGCVFAVCSHWPRPPPRLRWHHRANSEVM